MNGIFDARPGSRYDDDIETRYHFPNRFLAEVQKTVGDWIIYRAPRRGGGRIGYFAAARVVKVDPDPAAVDHSYARMAEFLPFDDLVPLRERRAFMNGNWYLSPNGHRSDERFKAKLRGQFPIWNSVTSFARV